MTKQVQRRRGTATQHTSFTGAEGEISVNTTNKSVHVHDGSTAGGIEAARADLTNVADADLNTALSGNTLASLTITSADINGGSIDGTTIGANSAAAITGTSFVSSGDMTFGDNDKAIFGAGSELSIYSDGTNGYIEEAGGGNLRIITNGPSVAINKGTVGGENMALFNADGAVQLFYDNSQKLATESGGVNVTGTLTSDGLTVDGASDLNGTVTVGTTYTTNITGNDIQFFRNNGASYIQQRGGYALAFQTNDGSDRTRLNIESNGDISFYEYTGTTPKFFWDASAESLGIGTSSPASNRVLHVSSTAQNQARFERTGSATSQIEFNDSTTTNQPSLGGVGDNLTFRTAFTERMRIDSSGNLLVGMTSANTNNDGGAIREDGLIHGKRAGVVGAFNRKTSDGDILQFAKDNSPVGTIGVTNNDIYIGTGDTTLTFIDGSNNINPTGTSGAQRSDAISLGDSNNRFKDGYFSGTVNAANFNTTSDATLKTNVEPLTGSLDAVKAMRGVSYDWIENGNSEVGVIAQEVEEVIPDVVSTNDQGIKSVKYGNLVGVLIEAIKEQQAQIDELKARLGD